jgi:hypothetical protein
MFPIQSFQEVFGGRFFRFVCLVGVRFLEFDFVDNLFRIVSLVTCNIFAILMIILTTYPSSVSFPCVVINKSEREGKSSVPRTTISGYTTWPGLSRTASCRISRHASVPPI